MVWPKIGGSYPWMHDNNYTITIVEYKSWLIARIKYVTLVPSVRWYSDDLTYHVLIIPTRGYWFQTNPQDNELDDHADHLCVYLWLKIWHFSGKFDQHLSLLWFCKTKIQDRDIGSCESVVSYDSPKFTNNFGTVSLHAQLKAVHFLSQWNNVENHTLMFPWNQCQGNRDVCIHFDISLYQGIEGHIQLTLIVHVRLL